VRNRGRFILVVSIIFCFATVMTAIGCSVSRKWQSWKSPEGVSLRWRPASPKIGDLVSVEVFFPAANSGLGSDSALRGPDGSALAALDSSFVATGRVLRWAVRLTRPGDWTWGTASGAQKLWTVATVAGEASELKTLDAQALWTGRGKLAAPVAPTGAGGQQTAGAPAKAAP